MLPMGPADRRRRSDPSRSARVLSKKVVCVWCQEEGKPALMAEKEPLDDPSESHDLCPNHRKQVEEEFNRVKAELSEKVDPGRAHSARLRAGAGAAWPPGVARRGEGHMKWKEMQRKWPTFEAYAKGHSAFEVVTSRGVFVAAVAAAACLVSAVVAGVVVLLVACSVFNAWRRVK